MDLIDKAAKLSNLKKQTKNETEWILTLLSLVKDENLTELLDMYKQIERKEIDVVTIVSSIELDENQKISLKKKIRESFKDKSFGFDFQIDQDIHKGISIMIRDNHINLD